MPDAAIMGIAIGGGLIVLIFIFKLMWRVAEPNEALIISGLGAKAKNRDTADSLGFKIVTGKGTIVWPGFQTARRLKLDSRAANLELGCVSKQGIQVHVRGVVIYKVGDDFVSIANAARRFLGQQGSMDGAIHELFTGHLRAIIGTLTVEALLRERETLNNAARDAAADEMSKLGLIVDSLQIQDVSDEFGYIENLGKPDAAKVESAARIAAAERHREAVQREQAAEADNAAAVRDTQIKQATYHGEVDQAKVQAQQQVIMKETKNAELAAERAEKQLEAEVRKPADAKAYETVTLAEADRQSQVAVARAEAEATRVKGEAEADARRVKGVAEADAIKARADALAQNQDAVIAQQLADNWPAIAAAGAEAFSNVDNMVVLNGAEGMEDMLAKALTLGGTGFGVARQILSTMDGKKKANGQIDVEVVAKTEDK